MGFTYIARVPSAYKDVDRGTISGLDTRDDNFYIGTRDGWLVKLDEHFEIEWEEEALTGDFDNIEDIAVNSIGEVYWCHANSSTLWKYDPVAGQHIEIVTSLDVEGIKRAVATGLLDDYVFFAGHHIPEGGSIRSEIGRVSADDVLIWTYTASLQTTSNLAVDDVTGAVYFASYNKLIKIDTEGNEEWEYDPNFSLGTETHVGAGLDGYVYFAVEGQDRGVRKISTDGVEQWVFDFSTVTTHPTSGNPDGYDTKAKAVHANQDGDVYVGDDSEGVVKLDSNGNFVWRFGYAGGDVWRLLSYSDEVRIYVSGSEIRRLGPFPKRWVNGEWKEHVIWAKRPGALYYDSETETFENEPWNHVAWRRI